MTFVHTTGHTARLFDVMASLNRFKDIKERHFKSLTSREKAVLALVAEGFSNPSIAVRLGISRVTVQNHRANIRKKLGISTEPDYLRYALAFDLVRL